MSAVPPPVAPPGGPPLVRARRGPAAAAAVVALVAAGAIGTAACATDLQLLAAGATAVAVLLLVPALRLNRATLPAAVLAGAVPAVLGLRAHAFPRYDLAAVGVLLVLAAEFASRARYLRSTAPRAAAGPWLGSVLVLAGAGAATAAITMAVGRTRLDGAIVLTLVGAGALTATGIATARGAHR